jgi:predicted enzyme related to lactoylglutathione lyase
VDLATPDPSAASSFYGEVFGWETEELGPEAGGYSLLRLHGKQIAGVGPVPDPLRPPAWSVYLATRDANDTASKVTANGGTVLSEPIDIGDLGRMAVFSDPTGATFSVWQPGRSLGAEIVNENGALSWAELMTPDIDIAKNFYEHVFPVHTRDVPMPDGNMYTLLEAGGESVAGAMEIQPEMGPVPPHWSPYFAVADTNGTADRAIELGATESLRQDSEAGRFAILTDPQGATFSIITPNPDYRP